MLINSRSTNAFDNSLALLYRIPNLAFVEKHHNSCQIDEQSGTQLTRTEEHSCAAW